MLLANSGKALQRSLNCQEFGSEVRFQAEGPAASDMIAEFANSISSGTETPIHPVGCRPLTVGGHSSSQAYPRGSLK